MAEDLLVIPLVEDDPLIQILVEELLADGGFEPRRKRSSLKYKSVPTVGRCRGHPRYPASEQAIISGIKSLQDYRETLMPWPSNKMRELRTALALALGLAIAAFGTAIVAASYIAK